MISYNNCTFYAKCTIEHQNSRANNQKLTFNKNSSLKNITHMSTYKDSRVCTQTSRDNIHTETHKSTSKTHLSLKWSRDNIKTHLSTNYCHQTESCMRSFDRNIFIWSWPILTLVVRRFLEANNLTARAVTRTHKRSKTLVHSNLYTCSGLSNIFISKISSITLYFIRYPPLATN